ncbi:barstar family protein [Streptomyces sp. NPDC059786]|uniref:barstar family protein n=1 Tax=Streptomyces sp. NPDC059786 TaxID=3346946 RepID=UPI00365BB8B8
MTSAPLGEALRAVDAAGWRVTVLDLTGVTDRAGLMDRCVSALGLPDWFGRNWDALADCLGDPEWGPADPGRLLVVGGWQGYAAARPDEWRAAQEILTEAAGRRGSGAALSVVLALEAPPGADTALG